MATFRIPGITPGEVPNMMSARSREPSCSQSSAWRTHQLHARNREAGQSHTSSLTVARDELIHGQVSKNYTRRRSCPLHETNSSATRRRGESTHPSTVIFSPLARSRNGGRRLVNSKRFWVSAFPIRRVCTVPGGPTRGRAADTVTLLPGRRRDGGRERWTSKRRRSCSPVGLRLPCQPDHRCRDGDSPSRRSCPPTIQVPGRKASRSAASKSMTTWDA